MKKTLSVLLVVASFGIGSTFADEVAATNKAPVSVTEPSAVTNKITLKVVKADSEETAGEDGKASNAVDGNPDTIWHTQWQDASPAHPHEIVIELSEAVMIKGFTYLPRQGDSENGMIKDFEFFVSEDGKEFGEPVKKDAFTSGKDKKTITFEPKKCRYVKLKALSEINGEAWTSVTEIGVVLAEQVGSK
jgi:hypothetical protein